MSELNLEESGLDVRGQTYSSIEYSNLSLGSSLGTKKPNLSTPGSFAKAL